MLLRFSFGLLTLLLVKFYFVETKQNSNIPLDENVEVFKRSLSKRPIFDSFKYNLAHSLNKLNVKKRLSMILDDRGIRLNWDSLRKKIIVILKWLITLLGGKPCDGKGPDDDEYYDYEDDEDYREHLHTLNKSNVKKMLSMLLGNRGIGLNWESIRKKIVVILKWLIILLGGQPCEGKEPDDLDYDEEEAADEDYGEEEEENGDEDYEEEGEGEDYGEEEEEEEGENEDYDGDGGEEEEGGEDYEEEEEEGGEDYEEEGGEGGEEEEEEGGPGEEEEEEEEEEEDSGEDDNEEEEYEEGDDADGEDLKKQDRANILLRYL